MPTRLTIACIYPDLLSTYGDRGNVMVLKKRARWRGIGSEVLSVRSDQPVPTGADIYVLGGGEDRAQRLAARRLHADGGLARAADAGAVILGICAGYQILGASFHDHEGRPTEGLGLLNVTSERRPERAVGEIVAVSTSGLAIPLITGFENHQGCTTLGDGVEALGQVVHGVGNGSGTEGARRGRILGTYLHGPLLARNPELADILIRWAVECDLPSIDDTWITMLRHERLARYSPDGDNRCDGMAAGESLASDVHPVSLDMTPWSARKGTRK